MSTVKVNTISTWTGSDVGIETGKTISGTASQFKMTDVVQGDVLYGSAADTLSRLAPGTSGQVLQTQGAGANPVWAADAGGLFSGYAIFADQKAQNTNGGTFTSGAWRQRDLNTTIANTDTTNITLGTNEFTLLAGNYFIQWTSNTYGNISYGGSRLYDGTSSVGVGHPTYEAAYRSLLLGDVRVTPGTSTTYQLQNQCSATVSTWGFGLASNYSVEQYTTVLIFKES